ncbi:MAG: 4'-phosphopantetheinyl transferase family protein [Polyangiaceae bacterium]
MARSGRVDIKRAFEPEFDRVLAHGRCVGVRLPASDEAVRGLAIAILRPEEVRIAEAFPPLRRVTWVGGRVALRLALGRAGIEAPLLISSDDRGAPVLPPGIAGSITHKEHIAAALVAREANACIGVDLEPDVVRSQDIADRVLTDGERAQLAGLDAAARGREVLLRFSAKEAIYKALDPFVRRYVGFQEVSVSPREDGTCAVTWALRSGEGPFAIDVRWMRQGGIVLTTARVLRA